MSRLYDELAECWPLLSNPTDYAGEAAFLAQVFLDVGIDDGSPRLNRLFDAVFVHDFSVPSGARLPESRPKRVIPCRGIRRGADRRSHRSEY